LLVTSKIDAGPTDRGRKSTGWRRPKRAHFWAYGEPLRRWHNKEFGLEDAEGTVNPAILTFKGGNS
jgi:hypothetical protein